MNRRIFYNFAFCFLLSAFSLNSQEPLEEILTIQNPFSDYQFSSFVKEGSGDVNGDGYNDFIVSKNNNNDFGLFYGEVYLYLGKPLLTSTPDYILTGVDDDMFGYKGSLAGDINGDGYNDVVISAIGAEPAGAGAVYIYLGGDPFDTEVDYIIYGYEYAQVLYISFHYGCYLSAEADFNNDGYNDLVIGGNGPSMSFEGQVDIFLGGDPFDTESDFCLYGQNYFDGYGGFVIGDINGDGYDDFLPSHREDSELIIDIFSGCEDFPPDSPVATLNMDSLGYNGYQIVCEDIDGDFYKDIIYTHSYLGNHFINILLGDMLFSLSNIDSINCYDGGFTNLFTSDINNDNQQDIIVSFEFDTFQHYAGSSYIYYGGTILDTIPDIIMTGSVNYEYFGKVGYDLGDVNGDGNNDILLGSSKTVSCTIDDYVTVYTEENLVSADNEIITADFKLSNYPNPFNPLTTIYFSNELYEQNEQIEINIYNIRGQNIRQFSIFYPQSSITWDGTDQNNDPVSSGVYLYKLKAENKIQAVNKCLLLK